MAETGDEWAGGLLSFDAQHVAAGIAAVSFAGPPPVESASVVTLTWSQVYWIGAMWLVSLIAMGQTFVSLLRARHEAEDARDSASKERDSIRQELDTKRSNQVLSDLMSDQWEFAVHELLKKPPAQDGSDLTQWRNRVRDWEKWTVELMRQHGCTKQDIRSLDVIGLAPWINGLHTHPASNHAMSMLVAQMDRVAGVARKYGD